MNSLIKTLILILYFIGITNYVQSQTTEAQSQTGIINSTQNQTIKAADRKKEKSKAVFIVLDDEEITFRRPSVFLFEIFFLLSGFNYRESIATEVPNIKTKNELGTAVGLYFVNHFGFGISFGLKFPYKNDRGFHSGHLSMDIGSTFFPFTDSSSILSFRHYGLYYKHRFHFLTFQNFFLPFLGITAGFNVSIVTVDNLDMNNLNSVPLSDLIIKYPFSVETGISYKKLQTWLDFSYGRVGRLKNNFGITYYIGWRVGR